MQNIVTFVHACGALCLMPLACVQGKASADHTTLLLNCYTKLKDVDKLDHFLRGSAAADTAPSLNFDVETAVKVSFMT